MSRRPPLATHVAYQRMTKVSGSSLKRGALDASCHASHLKDRPFDVAISIIWPGPAEDAREEMGRIVADAEAEGCHNLEGGVNLEHIPEAPEHHFPANVSLITLAWARDRGAPVASSQQPR